MAIVIDFVCVVVGCSTIDLRFPGGSAAYERDCPNSTYCSDGKICRVAFMVEADARSFVERLTQHGFTSPSSEEASDVALVAERHGLLHPCSWLDVDLRIGTTPDGRRVGFTIAWLRGEDPAQAVAPSGWSADDSVMSGELTDSYEFVKVDQDDGGGQLETYRHRETGKLVYVGRPVISPAKRLRQRFTELRNELNDLEERPSSGSRDQALTSFLERAAKLVEDTHSQETDPLFLQGLAARFRRRWDLAADSFSAVTKLRPDSVDAWLELTWALASLERFDEAESSARQAVALVPDSVETLGNLASALLQRDNLDEALVTINRALEIDPSDATNQLILERIREAQALVASAPRLPWYRRLWGK